jgi:acyl-lipid omega-6 desaturase (Delta-12 desaturase)
VVVAVSIQDIKRQKQDIIRRHTKPNNLKGLAQAFTTLVPIALLWWGVSTAESIMAGSLSNWLIAAAIPLLCLFHLRGLVLMHECGHGSLFRTSWLNHSFGFLFGVVAGMPQYVWSRHHDFHHANNGNWEKYRGPLTTPSVDEYEAMTSAQQLTYRVTRSAALAPLGGFVYLIFNPRFTWLLGSMQFLVHVLKRKLAKPSEPLAAHAATFSTRYWNSRTEYWHMFANNLVLLSIWTAMIYWLGPALFFTVYLISLSCAGGFGIALFTLQHNFEHAYATDSERWDYDTGAIEGTSFLVLPGWLNWFTANIAYHHVHHLSAKIPNYCLVDCHNENAHLFERVTRVRMSEMLKSLKCLLWDTRAQVIVSFAENLERRRQLAPALARDASEVRSNVR